MVRILEKPAALSFSGNLTKFLVESDQPFAFSLKKKSAASSIFEHTYYPGTDKRSRIDVSNIIEDYLYFTLQANTNVHLQPNIKGVFVATIDTQTVEFEVIRGGISNLEDTTTNWLKHNFLTWQPIEKNVTYHSPEWISWYAVSTCALMLDATFEDQSRKSIKIADCQPGNVYTANLQYGYIAGLLGKLPSYYDVYLLYTDSQKSQVQRYLASDPKNEDEIYVGWENSLGGYDVARMSGYSTFENEGKHEIGANGDSLEEYNTELSKKHVCNTGLMTLNERFWFVDFFISKRRHVYIDNAMREIVLSEDKGSIDTAETIDGLSFTFREKEDSKYLNVPRLRELPSNITIPVPSLPDFNLPPRLVEYARITLDEGVLIPAQHPASQTCGVTTWGAMSTIINKWITDAIAGIKFPDIPDIPETLPPGPHKHEISDVNQLKNELEKRFLKSDVLASTDEDTVVSEENVYSALRAQKEDEKRLLKETFDALFRYDQTLDCLFVTKPIAVQGGVTMFADAGTLDLPSIYDGIPLGDGLIWKDGKIVATGGGGSGTMDHNALSNRNAANQHSISAITGLQSALDEKLSLSVASADYWHKGNSNLASVDWTAKTFGGEEFRIKGISVITAGGDWNDFGNSSKKVSIHSSLNPDVVVGGNRYNIWHSGNCASPFIYKGWISPNDLNKTIDKGNGDYVVAYDGATQRLITFGGGGGSCSSMELMVDYHGNMKTRTSVDGSRFSDWYGIYTGRNSNLNTIDWNAKVIYAKTHQIMNDGFNAYFGAFGSDTYLWTESNHDLKFGTNNQERVRITKDGLIGIGCTPIISLAIGDSDTGFKWGSDGLIYAAANGVNAFAWTAGEVATYKTVNMNQPAPPHGAEMNLSASKLYFTNQAVNKGDFTPLIKAQTALAGEGWLQNVILGVQRHGNYTFGSFVVRTGTNDQGSTWNDFCFESWGDFTAANDIVAGRYGSGAVFYRPATTGYGWHYGNGALTIDVRNNSSQTPLLLARREGDANDRLFSIEQLNSGTQVAFMQKKQFMMHFTNANTIVLAKPVTIEGALHVKGNIIADGGITMLSDMRLKNKISNAESVLPSISEIDVFRYTLKADVAKRIYIGVSAQQIQGIWSEFVHGVETLSLDYAQMAAYVAIKGLQETKLWMDAKDKKIYELEKRIVELEKNVA